MSKIKSILVILFVLIVGCRKDEVEYCNLSDYARSYGSFKSGSYWIYQNDSNLILDSIYVMDLKLSSWSRLSESDHLKVKYQTLDCSLGSSINSAITFFIRIDSYRSYIRYHYFNLKANADAIYNSESLTKIPDRDWNSVSYHDTMNINNTVYTNVYEIENNFDFAFDYKKLNVFIASGIGLLKWNILYNDSTSESWSLVRLHIVN